MSSKTAHNPLNRRQKKALQNVINADVRTIEEIRNTMNVKTCTLQRWLQNENFCAALDRCLDNARRLTTIILARSLPDAAVRLNELLYTDKPDSDRKVCADILKLSTGQTKPRQPEKPQPPAPPATITDPVECARLYAIHRPVIEAQEEQEKQRLAAIDKMYNTAKG